MGFLAAVGACFITAGSAFGLCYGIGWIREHVTGFYQSGEDKGPITAERVAQENEQPGPSL